MMHSQDAKQAATDRRAHQDAKQVDSGADNCAVLLFEIRLNHVGEADEQLEIRSFPKRFAPGVGAVFRVRSLL